MFMVIGKYHDDTKTPSRPTTWLDLQYGLRSAVLSMSSIVLQYPSSHDFARCLSLR